MKRIQEIFGWGKWAISTAVAGGSMMIAALAYTHSYVYPRTEGEKLERRVDSIGSLYREDLKEVRENMKEIRKRLEEIADRLRR